MTPYTFSDHAAYCREQAQLGQVAAKRRVQVMKRRVVYCARLVDLWVTPEGTECWTVEADSPERCRMTVPVKLVRACGDGCVCSGAAQ